MVRKPKIKKRPTCLVFCCGGGLTSDAIKDAGYEVLGGIDPWDFAELIYKKNFPDSKFLKMSLRELTPQRICEEFNIVPGEIDFIQISNPCTGASTLGEGEPTEAVNDLFFVCTALAFALRPKTVAYENVKGLTRKDMVVLLGMFWAFLQRTAVEYNVDALIMNSWLYGDPQLRERIIIMCVRKDIGHPVWPESVPLNQRKYIRDVIPEAEYLSSRNYGPKVYYDFMPAPTITAHPDLVVYDGVSHRKVTPREYAKFMGLPDSFILEGAIANQEKILGNGVPWNMMRALAKTILVHVLGYDEPDDDDSIAVMKHLPLPSNRPLDRGFVIYNGPSELNGEEIVAILTLTSVNRKTGDMAQLWIMNAAQPPVEAARTGADQSVCGDCKLRFSEKGICYVNLGKAPAKVWESWKGGKYPSANLDKYGQLLNIRVRVGAYGDPAALPNNVLRELLEKSENHTCYTHQWRNNEHLKDVSMASVESQEEYDQATSTGWRTFRIIRDGDPLMRGEIMCPHPATGVQCRDCNLCSGGKIGAKNIAIPVHGGGKSKFNNIVVLDEPDLSPKMQQLKKSQISWTDYTWNPWVGCKKVSEGCKNCYMHQDLDRWKQQDPSSIRRTNKTQFNKPRRIKEPARVFTCSFSDFFIEEADAWRPDAWEIIRTTPHLTYQILTKRPERIIECLPADWGSGYNNVWLGVTVENQDNMWRAEILAKINARVRFISAEPLLGELELMTPMNGKIPEHYKWIIIGGERGNKNGKYVARPCKEEWIKKIIDDVLETDMSVFVKQTGSTLSAELGLRNRHGNDVSEFPSWMQVQEFPKVHSEPAIASLSEEIVETDLPSSEL